MFSAKSKKKETSPERDEFLEAIKKDMTNRAAIAAKQDSTIKTLVEALEAERKELRSMRLLYERRMKMDNEIIDRFMVLLDKRRQ